MIFPHWYQQASYGPTGAVRLKLTVRLKLGHKGEPVSAFLASKASRLANASSPLPALKCLFMVAISLLSKQAAF